MTNKTKVNAQQVMIEICTALNTNPHALATSLGVSYSKIWEIYSGRTKRITPVVENLLVNAGVRRKYIQTGEGNVLNDVQQAIIDSAKEAEGNEKKEIVTSGEEENFTDAFLDVVAKLNKKIRVQRARIEELEAYVEQLESRSYMNPNTAAKEEDQDAKD